MKKLILMLAIMLPLIFISCSDGKKNPLVGTWVQDEKSVHLHSEEEILFLQNMIFMEDGTGARWSTSPKIEDDTPGGGEMFKWSATENQIDIYTTNRKDQLKYSIINSQLIVYGEDNNGITFNRASGANIDSLKNAGMFKPIDIIEATKLLEMEKQE